MAHSFLEDAEFGIYDSEHRSGKENASRPKWERLLRERYPVVTSEMICHDCETYFVQNSYENTMELLDLNVRGGVYIHSGGVPLGSFDPAYHNMRLILDKLGLKYVPFKTGGTLCPTTCIKWSGEWIPTSSVPVHSFHPEQLRPFRGRQLLPETGTEYELVNGELFCELERSGY